MPGVSLVERAAPVVIANRRMPGVSLVDRAAPIVIANRRMPGVSLKVEVGKEALVTPNILSIKEEILTTSFCAPWNIFGRTNMVGCPVEVATLVVIIPLPMVIADESEGVHDTVGSTIDTLLI